MRRGRAWQAAGIVATLVLAACASPRFGGGEPQFVVEDADGLVATVALRDGDDLAVEADVDRSVCVEVTHRAAHRGEACTPAVHGGMLSIGYAEDRTLVLAVADGPHLLRLQQEARELRSDRDGHTTPLEGYRVHLLAVVGPGVDDGSIRAVLRDDAAPADRPVEHELLAGEGAHAVVFPPAEER